MLCVDEESRSEEVVVGLVKLAVKSGKALDKDIVEKDVEENKSNHHDSGKTEKDKMLKFAPGMPKITNNEHSGEMIRGLALLDEVMLGRDYYREWSPLFTFLKAQIY